MRTPFKALNSNHFPLVIGNTRRRYLQMIKTLKPQPYLKIIPFTWTECFKEDVKEIKREITSLKGGQFELVKTFGESQKGM